MKKIILNLFIFSALLVAPACNSDASEQRSDGKVYVESTKKANSKLLDSITVTRHNAITKAVSEVSPAIVGINVTEVVKVRYRDSFFDDPFFERFFGRSTPRYKQYEIQGVGSGFLISGNGYILTNHHVAGDASKILVTMTDGKQYEADIIGSDYVSDVALLKIKGDNFPYLKLSNSDDVIIGEWSIAFGNPFGLFSINAKPTVTVGVISNIGVSFVQENRVYKDMLQTDAAISSGNSGGPLVNAHGEVIGINTVIYSTSQSQRGAGSIGIGFSIPINRVKSVVDKLMKDKKINRDFFIGMEVRKNDERLSKYLGLATTDGMVVVNLQRNSPASKSGIEPGDVIVKINGGLINSEEDYQMIILDSSVGDELEIEILRDSKTFTRTIKLEQFRR